jgi:phosphohistidine phosphatase
LIIKRIYLLPQNEVTRMDLYIMRHGKAGHSSGGQDDRLRALTPAGRKEIRAIARWLKAEKIPFDLIASSPLVRARETAGILARTLGLKEQAVIWEDLSPGGDPDTVCFSATQSGGRGDVLIIGHEPDMSGLIGKIISPGGAVSVIFSKGGLAKIRYFSFDDRHPSGVLEYLLTARQIQAMR